MNYSSQRVFRYGLTHIVSELLLNLCRLLRTNLSDYVVVCARMFSHNAFLCQQGHRTWWGFHSRLNIYVNNELLLWDVNIFVSHETHVKHILELNVIYLFHEMARWIFYVSRHKAIGIKPYKFHTHEYQPFINVMLNPLAQRHHFRREPQTKQPKS